MIYFATVHHKTSKWISIQLKYFRLFVKEQYAVYASIEGLNLEEGSSFDRVIISSGSHAEKLNELADLICKEASDEDYIIFIDGDCFPINDIDVEICKMVDDHQLIAVKRVENFGDQQPHPCFCMTTCGLWRSIKGDWKEGYAWSKTRHYRWTDVGGNLLAKLDQHQINWLPLLRSNLTNYHPLYFGIYGDLVYHHGAGFHSSPGGMIGMIEHFGERIFMRKDIIILSRIIKIYPWLEKILYYLHPFYRKKVKLIRKVDALSERVYQTIINDDHFYQQFGNN